jgi:hypothetical protein
VKQALVMRDAIPEEPDAFGISSHVVAAIGTVR